VNKSVLFLFLADLVTHCFWERRVWNVSEEIKMVISIVVA